MPAAVEPPAAVEGSVGLVPAVGVLLAGPAAGGSEPQAAVKHSAAAASADEVIDVGA